MAQDTDESINTELDELRAADLEKFLTNAKNYQTLPHQQRNLSTSSLPGVRGYRR
jgi:hypothetical protein